MPGIWELLFLFMAIAVIASPVIAIVVVLRVKKNQQHKVNSTGDRLMQRAEQKLKENRARAGSSAGGGE